MAEPFFEAPTGAATRLHPRDLVGACFEHGARDLLLDAGALPAEFFDLSSGIAGDLVQRVTNYGIRTAVVVPDLGQHSTPFQDFARESGRSRHFRVFPQRERAIEWLAAGP